MQIIEYWQWILHSTTLKLIPNSIPTGQRKKMTLSIIRQIGKLLFHNLDWILTIFLYSVIIKRKTENFSRSPIIGQKYRKLFYVSLYRKSLHPLMIWSKYRKFSTRQYYGDQSANEWFGLVHTAGHHLYYAVFHSDLKKIFSRSAISFFAHYALGEGAVKIRSRSWNTDFLHVLRQAVPFAVVGFFCCG